MCGIVGYIGKEKAQPILIEGLSKLEYRGYDSAGVSLIENNNLITVKNKGRIKDLETLLNLENYNSNIGIAHTRWATHGKPSSTNAHPHNDNSNTFSVVHNGIIENHNELRDFLKNNNYNFLSETDTEVIPNLLHFYFSETNERTIENFLKSVNKACQRLTGSYALEIICTYFPNTIIVCKKDSPLVIGKGENENFISSDVTAFLSRTQDFYYLNDYEYALIKDNLVTFYDKNLNIIQKNSEKITWSADKIEKSGYEDFMLKEIYEQPITVRETISSYMESDFICHFVNLNFSKEYLDSINKIYIVACGTAMHAGLTGKYLFEKLLKIPTEVEIASEFRYRNPLIDEKTLCIFISQSGETADTIAALKLAKLNNSKTIAISNVKGSSITREADYSIYTYAGPEVAVASTKAYTSQITVLVLLSIYFAEILGISRNNLHELKTSLIELPTKIESILSDTSKIQNFAHKYKDKKEAFFLGRNLDYNTASEGSLKLKEISYIHSEAFYSGELKHGPIALIENNTLVVSIITVEKLAEKSLSNVQEVISRGADTLVITNHELTNNFTELIKIPSTHQLLTPILSIIPLQLLAYYVSKEKGLDVDKPRNLAKSVTVE